MSLFYCPTGMDRTGEFSYKQPSHFMHAQVAQLVEHSTENAGVGCSIQPLGTTFLRLFGRLKFILGSASAFLDLRCQFSPN